MIYKIASRSDNTRKTNFNFSSTGITARRRVIILKNVFGCLACFVLELYDEERQLTLILGSELITESLVWLCCVLIDLLMSFLTPENAYTENFADSTIRLADVINLGLGLISLCELCPPEL